MTKTDVRKQEINVEAKKAIIANPLRQAEKGISNRLFGDVFEHAINCSFGLLERSQVTQKLGKIDCVKYAVINGKKKQVRIEIKQGASPLAILNPDGSIKTSALRKSHFVCYHPRFIPCGDVVDTAVEECVFFTVEEFLEILQRFNAIRTKCTGTQNDNKKAGLPYYDNQQAIQTMFNKKSPGRFNKFCDTLYFEGMDYQTFVQTYKISNIYNY